MQVVVKRSAIRKLLEKLLSENRSIHSRDIAEIPAKSDDEPIEPIPQMATQLSVDIPPVDDEQYIPASIQELERSAAAIASEVPDSQIKYFYSLLHRILDKALDRDDFSKYEMDDEQFEQGSEEGFDIDVEDVLAEAIRNILKEQDDDDDTPDPEELLQFRDRPDLSALPGESATLEDRAYNDAVDYFHSETFFKPNLIKPEFIDITQGGQKFPFRVGYTRGVEEVEGIVKKLIRQTPGDAMKELVSGGPQVVASLENRLIAYVKPFLKDPSRVTPEDLSMGKAHRSVEAAYKKSEDDPVAFKSMLDELVKSESDPEMALKMKLVGMKYYQAMVEPEEEIPEDEFDELQQVEVDEDEDPKQKETDASQWTRIAELEGFSGAAGARQFAFKPMIKYLLLSEVIDDSTFEVVMSRAGMAYRKEIIALQQKGQLDQRQAMDLRGSARVGPEVKGNESFRFFLSLLIFQPFISGFVNEWKQYAQTVLSKNGIDDPKMTFAKMLVGETSPASDSATKKILSVMTMPKFNSMKNEVVEFAKQRERVSKAFKEFALSRVGSKPKVKNAVKKSLASAGA